MDNPEPFLRRDRLAVKRRRFSRAGRFLLASALALSLGAFGLLRLLGGSLFALERFEISGQERTRTEEVVRSLETWRAGNLVTLDLGAVANGLSSLPWIERVTVSKRFPDGLSVQIVEKKAVALFTEQGRIWWLDETGRPIALYDPRADPGDYVVISGDRRALPGAVALLEELEKAHPEYVAALSEIHSLPDGDFGMMDSIFRRPVRVLRRDAREKIGALLKARGLIESRGWEARAIDLRFKDRIVLEGGYGAGNSL